MRPARAAKGSSAMPDAIPPKSGRTPAWYTPERARALCARIAEGETLRSICAEPGMPGEPTIFKHLRRNPDFADAYRKARGGALRNEAIRTGAHLPRRPRPKDPRKPGRPSRFTPKMVATLCARLAEGETLTAICEDPAMPSMASVHKWLRQDVPFRRDYLQARQVQADRLFDELRDVARAATPRTVAVARLNCDVIRWQAARLAPRRYGYYAGEELEAERRDEEGGSAPWTVVIRQFGMVDGKVVEVLTPKDAVSYEDAHRRALPAPEAGIDPERWAARDESDWWGEAQK